MSNFSIDYNKLSEVVDVSDKVVFKLSDVKHKLEKVAFDVFRMKDGKPDELWEIQNSDDGDYIVARYNAEEAGTEVKTSSVAWETLITNGDVNVFYKGQPITKLASVENADVAARLLPTKLANDKSFVSALLSTLDENTRSAIYKQYPELK
jgi:hypothetical protein